MKKIVCKERITKIGNYSKTELEKFKKLEDNTFKHLGYLVLSCGIIVLSFIISVPFWK